MKTSLKSCLKYPGSKQRIAKWIINYIPEHHSYLEPFAGGLSVLFAKQRSNIETINDLDENVVNLFSIIRDNPQPLLDALLFTPYSRSEYENAYLSQSNDPIEKARIFLLLCWQGYNSRTNGYRPGWKNDVNGREASYAVKAWNRLPETIIPIIERLKDVQIENMPAVDLIKRFNRHNVFIYADPPYVLSTRQGRAYKHEMTDKDHIDFLQTMCKHKGPAMISGYDNEIYSHYLHDWHSESIHTTSESGAQRVETIWMNYEQPQIKFA